MKNLLFRRYPLIGNYLIMLVIGNVIWTSILYMVLTPEGRNHIDVPVMALAMATTCNLILIPIMTFLMPGFVCDTRPKRGGVWEWYSIGKRHLVCVCDCSVSKDNSYLRVAWNGGYYDVHNSVESLYDCNGKFVLKHFKPSEWTSGMWGNRVDDLNNMNKYKILDTTRDL